VTDAHIGQLAGLTTAALWVVSSLSFTAAGKRLGATRVNLLRTIAAALVLLLVQWFVLGRVLPTLSNSALIWLSLSGVFGLTIGDQFLFTGYVLLGPRTVSLLMTLAPSLSALIAWIGFGERMAFTSVLGMLITTGGIAWVTIGRNSGALHRDPNLAKKGLLFCLAAALCQAVGMVMAKQGLNTSVGAFDAQTIRMYAGAASMIPVAIYVRHAGISVAPQVTKRAMMVLALGTISGPLLGVYFSMLAVEKIPVGVAATLIGLVPVFIIPASRLIDKQHISTRSWIGAMIAVMGIAVLALGGNSE